MMAFTGMWNQFAWDVQAKMVGKKGSIQLRCHGVTHGYVGGLPLSGKLLLQVLMAIIVCS